MPLISIPDAVGVQSVGVVPFAGIRKDVFIYCRGTPDDRDNVTAVLMVTLAEGGVDVRAAEGLARASAALDHRH